MIDSAVTRRRDKPFDLIKDDNAAWSNALLNAVLDFGDEHGFTVYPRRLYFRRSTYAGNSKYDQPKRGDDRGEYLFDACWTRYPKTAAGWRTQLAQGPLPPPRIWLACESEWVATVRGARSTAEHVASVLDDFAKLTDVVAPLKVLLFAFRDEVGATFDDIAKVCASAAGATPSKTPTRTGYLLLGWSIQARWGTLPTVRYLSDQAA